MGVGMDNSACMEALMEAGGEQRDGQMDRLTARGLWGALGGLRAPPGTYTEVIPSGSDLPPLLHAAPAVPTGQEKRDRVSGGGGGEGGRGGLGGGGEGGTTAAMGRAAAAPPAEPPPPACPQSQRQA